MPVSLSAYTSGWLRFTLQHAGAIVERYRAAVSVLRLLETLCIELTASLDSYMSCLRSSGQLSSRYVDAAGASRATAPSDT